MRRFRDIDVIFCRNMLIYFDDTSRRETIEAMYDCLAPGGFICLGHSESMSRISALFRPRSTPTRSFTKNRSRPSDGHHANAETERAHPGHRGRHHHAHVLPPGLEDAGFEVEEAVNGVEGVERAMAESFDLMVVDVNMPKMDGYEVIRAVREDEALWRVPVITISTEWKEQDAQKAYSAGANFYLTKPVRPKDLVEMARLLTGTSMR